MLYITDICNAKDKECANSVFPSRLSFNLVLSKEVKKYTVSHNFGCHKTKSKHSVGDQLLHTDANFF